MPKKASIQKNSILEKYNPQFEYLEAIMLAVIGVQYLQLWVSPSYDDPSKIFQMATLIAFEFIMVHSGVFMAMMPKKITLFLLVPIYGLFAYAFNSTIGDNSIVILYSITVFNRMRFAFFNANKKLRFSQITKSLIAVTLYFFLILIVAIGNKFVPSFGLSEENLININYKSVQNHGGLFLDEPKTAMCMGFLYYTLLAVIAVVMNRRKKS